MTHSPRRAARHAAVAPFYSVHPTALILSLIGIAGVVLWGLAVVPISAVQFDIWLNNMHTPLWDGLAVLISHVFGPTLAVLVGLIFAAVVAWRCRSVAVGLGAGLAVGLAWASSYAVKMLVHRPRPDFALIPHQIVKMETDPSFPSGHTTFITCLAVVTVLLVWRTARWRATAIVVGVVLVVMVGFSRMYVGVHDIHDVSAALVYGVCASILAYAFIGWLLQKNRLRERVDTAVGLRPRAVASAATR